jgi:hypothetical protein
LTGISRPDNKITSHNQLRIISTLIGNLNRATTCYTLDIKFLTCSNVNLTDEQHCIILKYVFDYIKFQKDSLSYNWNWIGWTCTSYESILILFFLLFVNIYHRFVISAIYNNCIPFMYFFNVTNCNLEKTS